ncbi:MAG: chloride channel protein [Erysipelotrichaceae bacterium]
MKIFMAFFEDRRSQLFSCLRWLVFSCLVGLIVGHVGVVFHLVIEFVTSIRFDHPGIIYLLPLSGILIVFAYHRCGHYNPRGTDLVISSIRSDERIPLRMAPLIFFSTIITHLFGGSAGREGAALQIGASISSYLGKLLRLDEKDKKIITMCGMSACFAALFGTPITSAIFAMEVVSVGIMHYAAIVPCIFAAFIGSSVALYYNILPYHFLIDIIPTISFSLIIKVLIIAIICAFVSILFCLMLHKASEIFSRNFPDAYLRIIVGGVLIITLSVLLNTYDYTGAGMDIIKATFAGSVIPTAFFFKMLYTSITLGSGFKGGEIIPVMFVGSTLGAFLASILGIPVALGAGLGLVALFCGVTNCPLTSIIMSIELFGSSGLVLYAISVAVSYMLSDFYSLYKDQKIMYDKVKPTYIDHKTK